MIINLSPVRYDDKTLVVVREDSKLIVNGEVFDFSPMGDGDTLPRTAISSLWFDGDVNKENGELTLTLMLPIPVNYSQEQAFPFPLIDVQNGPVELPKPLSYELWELKQSESVMEFDINQLLKEGE